MCFFFEEDNVIGPITEMNCIPFVVQASSLSKIYVIFIFIKAQLFIRVIYWVIMNYQKESIFLIVLISYSSVFHYKVMIYCTLLQN